MTKSRESGRKSEQGKRGEPSVTLSASPLRLMNASTAISDTKLAFAECTRFVDRQTVVGRMLVKLVDSKNFEGWGELS